jgi:soluble lytic murein transglycosylase
MRFIITRFRRSARRHQVWVTALLVLFLAMPVVFVFLLRDEEPPEPELALPQPVELGRQGMPGATAVAYRQAAAAFREGDLEEAQRILAELAAAEPEQAPLARALVGLYAYERGFFEVAVETLAAPGAVGGALEDWRLLALADASRRLERPDVAAEALSRLLAEQRESPLRGRAYVEAAELAWDEGDPGRAMTWIREARGAQVTHHIAARADRLAWRIGRATGDRQAMEEAAKRLLVHAPKVARELRVHELFVDARGKIESWDGVLTPTQIVQRARSWIDLDAGRSAMSTLETVAPAERDLEWRLLMAEALTLQHRGRDALEALEAARPASPAERAAVEFQRARATAELATVRRGRTNLPVAERRQLLSRSRRHLERVVEVGGDPELSIEALRQLYGYLAEEGLFEQAVEKLRLLRRLDPNDRTGVGQLWERGWADYLQENYTGAVGYWTELEEVYPRDRETRRARYWKARAFDHLGMDDRARQGYRQVLEESDAADFYFGRAAARLPEAALVPNGTARGLAEPWGIAPRLDRPLRLAELGLASLAQEEMALVADDGVDPREMMALDGIVRVKRGEPREGVRLLRGAYPELASPYQGAVPGPVLTAYYPFLYGEQIEDNARRRRLPPHLVAGIIRQESAFDPRAESWAGARGLMQLMPATAKEVAGKLGQVYAPSRLFEPEVSILFGTTYFKQTLDRFDGNVELALAGYNGGPTRIRRLWREEGEELDFFIESLGIPESRDYVKRILVLADSYRQMYWNGHHDVVVSREDVRL